MCWFLSCFRLTHKNPLIVLRKTESEPFGYFFYPVALLGRATNPVETLFYRIASSPYNSQGSLNPMKNTFLLLLKENMFNLLYAPLNNILPLLTVLNSSVSKKTLPLS